MGLPDQGPQVHPQIEHGLDLEVVYAAHFQQNVVASRFGAAIGTLAGLETGMNRSGAIRSAVHPPLFIT